jgi:NodT family efflux transporter outer membrane factor (OMF) lipoprotein
VSCCRIVRRATIVPSRGDPFTSKTQTPGITARSAIGALTALALSSCAVGPDFAPPAAPAAGYGALQKTTQSAAVAGGGAQRLAPGRDVPGEWWALFRSPRLSALVTEAVKNHPDIAAAEAALRQARETIEADRASLLPSATANHSFNRQQISTAQYGGLGSSSSTTGSSSSSQVLYSLHNANATVSYSPDVFGKTRRQVESDEAAAENKRFQLEATYLALTANVVTAAITDASYASQIRVTRELIIAYQAQLDLLQKRFELGAVSQADVLSERALLAQAQATLPPLEKARAQTRNLLMAYLGRFPDGDKGEAVDLSTLRLPRELPLSLPAALVRQRPDVLSSESLLHQASADVGVATANMFPQFTVSAQGGTTATNFAALMTPETMVYNLASQASGQIFDAGALFHRREAKVAALEQASAQYRSTVISAVQNVADALQAVKQDAATLRAQVAAEKAAAQSLEIARIQYTGGATNYSTVLNAEQTLLNARLGRVQAQAARFADTAALFQALGGGWWNRVDETPASRAKPTDPIALSPIAAGIRAQAEEHRNAR